MNNFELHKEVQTLADTHSKYQLAKMVIEMVELLDQSDRFGNTDHDYLDSPFCAQVREVLYKHNKIQEDERPTLCYESITEMKQELEDLRSST